MARSLHPQAKFDPIDPALDLDALVDRTPNFEWALRIPAAQIARLGPVEFEKIVRVHVIQGGKPLVIEKWHERNRLPSDLFNVNWLEENYDKKQENVWDIGSQTNMPMTMGHYLRNMKQLADQWTSNNYRDERRQRLYLKDIDCPPEWSAHLQKLLPPNVFYLNSNVDERHGKPGARADDGFDEMASAAPAGDLMSSLPKEMRADNLMCYIGTEGTYTPAHREMCASLGQNIMVEASSESNPGEQDGSSIWFMTETKDREVVREYFLSILGHDVEIEKHFAQINAWKRANFPVYVVEQKVGDFILIPPLAPHQVWNRGTRTMKVAWNRTTIETLDLALREALPKARLVCRDEQYKNKAIIYYTLDKYYNDFHNSMEENDNFVWSGLPARMVELQHDFRQLFTLFTEILLDEIFSTKVNDVELLEFDSNITCSYCRCNIFNRFLTCKHCVRTLVNGDEDTYDICMECYAMGRSCVCTSMLSWCEQWPRQELVEQYEKWRTFIIKNDGFFDIEHSPPPLDVARLKKGQKSVAQICQEQLRRRPFRDITKPQEPEDLEPSEPEVDDNGQVVKKKKKGRKPKKGDLYRCHVCCHKDHIYELAFCTTPGCSEAYCFGALYRAFDLMPQTVLETERWKCPKCLNICSCGSCRRVGKTEPYTPKSTTLGHDTRRVADDRSIEVLVDFRLHNLQWLRNVGEDGRSKDSRRMQLLKQQAEADKANGSGLGPDGINGGAGPDGSDMDAATALQQAILNDHMSRPENSGLRESFGAGYENHHHQDVGQDVDGEGEPDFPDEANASSYPDPSAYPDLLPNLVGRGYYEQDDDALDKILFDPYLPPAEATLRKEQEEQSEFLKKSLRAAKRKAKQDGDNDPDFAGPRKRYKNKPRQELDDGQAQEMAVDPALLGEDMAMQDAVALAAAAGHAVDIQAGEELGQQDTPRKTGGGSLFPANVPSLRHAKPMLSYAEPDEAAADEEFNEIVEPKPAGDPLDLAAEAIRRITGAPPPPEDSISVPEDAARPVTAPKRRGRPPRKPIGDSAQAVVQKTTTRSQVSVANKRGRKSRTSLRAARVDYDEDEDEDADAADAANDHTPAQDSAAADEDEFRVETPEPEPEEPQPVRRRRGRPPKSATKNAPNKSPTKKPSPRGTSVDTRFLSMAERMALRGKRVKIRQRPQDSAGDEDHDSEAEVEAEAAAAEEIATVASTSGFAAVNKPRFPASAEPDPEPEPAPVPELEPEPVPEREDEEAEVDKQMGEPEIRARTNPPLYQARSSPPKSARPTIVRMLSDEEDEDNFETAAQLDDDSSDSDDDDDGDIPAVVKPYPAKAASSMISRGGPPRRGRGRPART